jgi:hypothetical protein
VLDQLVKLLVPLSFFFVPFALIMATLVLHRFLTSLRRKRSPFTREFLRGPGHSEWKRIEEITEKIDTWVFMLFFIPVIVYVFVIATLHADTSSLRDYLFVSTPFALLFLFGLYRLNHHLHARRFARLGYEGEMAVGQELNQLMADGYRVFHDFPAGKFNIDHVLIGPAGVFAVETKARSKPTSGDGKSDARVGYDGKVLKFPGWTEKKPLEQAKRQANWLSEELTKAVGDPVQVKPVLALPGWFVERTAPPEMLVLNGKSPQAILNKYPTILEPKMIQRIAHQVEQKCRDVKPRAYREWDK